MKIKIFIFVLLYNLIYLHFIYWLTYYNWNCVRFFAVCFSGTLFRDAILYAYQEFIESASGDHFGRGVDAWVEVSCFYNFANWRNLDHDYFIYNAG